MKYIASILVFFGILFAFAGTVWANPTNEHKAQFLTFVLSGKGNKNVVAYWPNSEHGIPNEPGEDHFGEDLVMKAGNSGNFHQWFLGFSKKEGYHGEHSLWMLKKGDKCPDDFQLIEDANKSWGDYLWDGDYCVKTNDYKLGNWWEHQDLPWTIPAE